MTITDIESLSRETINQVINYMIERNIIATTEYEIRSKNHVNQVLIPALQSRDLSNLREIEIADIKWYIEKAIG